MQSLDIISINVWQVLISLCNLVLLFFIVKKFLFRPVQKLLAKRKAEIDGAYAAAEKSQKEAAAQQAHWESQMQQAQAQADAIRKQAETSAQAKQEKMLQSAKEKADELLRQGRAEAALEKKKAQADFRKEAADLSAAMAEKILQREIRPQDHAEMIDAVLNEFEEETHGRT